MSVYLQYVPRAARGGVCNEGAVRGASSVTNTTDAPLNAEGKNRKRTLVRPSACFPQQSSLTLSFYKLSWACASVQNMNPFPFLTQESGWNILQHRGEQRVMYNGGTIAS